MIISELPGPSGIVRARFALFRAYIVPRFLWARRDFDGLVALRARLL